ncbi:MAG: alpha/beta fold hydrolase [Cyanobacteria bacterium SZAS LIN-3]|nr:alpha/beta fold hydrolase [Cyanobacteria bacterium SZAS LIN-3]
MFRFHTTIHPLLGALLLAISCNLLPFAPSALAESAQEIPADAKEIADDLYLQKHYTEALPHYQAIVDNLKKNAGGHDETLCKAESDLADCLCQSGHMHRARIIYEARLKALTAGESRGQKSTDADKTVAESRKKLFYNTEIAGTYFRQDNYGEAERYLNTAMALLDACHLDADARINQSTLLSIYLGESLYRQNRYLDAIKVFQTALDGVQKSPNVSYEYSKTLLSSLAGSYDQLKQFDKSTPLYRAMAILDRSYFGDTDINYGWSLLQLSDSLKAQGKQAESRPLYEKAVWIFRDHNCQRLAEKYGISESQIKEKAADGASPEQLAEDKKLAATLRSNVFGQGDVPTYKDGDKDLAPEGTELASAFDHCQAPRRGKLGAWNIKPLLHGEAPGWVWTDPHVPQKALMLCVPGLGLHHRAFQSFAERIVGQGFTVVSFDVRGFGAYMQAKGHDHLDMNGCVKDLISVIGLIRRDYKGKPIFLLGESMGGALALRVAAEQPDIIDGLVCSVPAAERHRETGTKLKVGLKLITGRNKPVDLAKTVVNKSIASNDFRERQDWLADPMARLKLSPRELVQFDLFMRQNKNFAAKVCHTPVLLFQGTSDRLVKEEGTQNLFRVMPTKDKALILLGNQEHLIFEANPYKDDVTLGIIGWMNAHADTQAACPVKVE